MRRGDARRFLLRDNILSPRIEKENLQSPVRGEGGLILLSELQKGGRLDPFQEGRTKKGGKTAEQF